ncbi:hypothetical protein HK098_005949 [Nowakowskiella sp. JEL0407]|nr:hypothetical protein HK098_005949 [Nowakowskiella sp. JEL0407]
MQWGVVPSWSKTKPDYASILRTINARDDTILQSKSMWSSMKNRQRCVVPCEGFFEWLKKGKERIPHYMTPKNGDPLFFFAGLYDKVTYPDDPEKQEPQYTYTIVTTTVCPSLSFLHDRMPVILTNATDINDWLNPLIALDQIASRIMQPQEVTKYVKVSNYVNKIGNDGVKCVEEVEVDGKGSLVSFFKMQQESDVVGPVDGKRKRGDGNEIKKEESEVTEDVPVAKKIHMDDSETVKNESEIPKPTIKPRPTIGEQLRSLEKNKKIPPRTPPKKTNSKSITDFFQRK